MSGGYKTVDYAKATAGARHARAMGGLVPESMGGAVLEPGNFARGGYLGGGLVTDPNDLQAILAQQKQSFGPFAQGGLYGGSSQQDPHGAAPGYVPKATLAVPKLVISSFQPKQQQGGLQSAMQDINAASTTASTLSKGYDWAQKKLEDKPAATTTSGTGSNPPLPPVRPSSEATGTKTSFGTDEDPIFSPEATVAHGGGIMPRHRFANGGPEDSFQDDFTTPGLVKEDKVDGKENRANVPASGFPTDVLSSGQSAKELAVAKNPSTSGGQSGMSSLAQGIGAANNALKAGKSISTMLGGGANAVEGGGTFAAGMGPFMSEAGMGAAGAGAAEGAGILGGLGSALGSVGEAALAILPFFSDARLKDNIKQVGKTFDGQNIYSYDMGDGRTQMGLLAQEVLHHKPEAVGKDQGYLTVDYRKATEDSAPHRAAGGLVPRQAFGGNDPGGAVQGYAITVPDELIPHFTAASEATGVPVPVLAAQAKQESRFRPDATGAAGEVGIGQILPSTARNPGYGMQGVDPAELRDPAKNIMFQAQYMKGIGDKLGVKDWSNPEQTAKALRAYNGGGDPNYVQNVFGHLYGSNAPKVGGAHQQQSYPLQEQIEGGLGKAKSMADSFAPKTYQGEDRTMGQFLTSKDFVIPLLTGLGTMASSPSRYLGAAILQGLGGGAQAYANLQKQQADIGQTLAGTGLTKATTEGTNVSTAAASIVTQNGQTMFLKRNPAGGFDVQRAFEYFKLPPQERTALGLSAADVDRLKAQAAKDGFAIGEDGTVKTEGGLKPPSVSTTAPPPPGAPKVEERNLLEPPLPDPKILTDEEKGVVERNLTAAQAANGGKDYYALQKQKGDSARNMQPLMRNLAVSMARLPESGSPNVPGPLAPFTTGITNVAGNLLRILGRDPSKLGVSETSDPQEIQKIIKNIAGDPQYQGNIHAHAILSDIAERFPTMINTREGQAKLMSSVMSLQRREIDKDDYNTALLQHANSIDPRMGALSGYENNALFERRYGRLNEQPVLEKMFLTPMVIDGKKQIDPETKRPMSQMEFLYKNGGQLSPAERIAIENQLKAPRVLRHFGL